MRLQDALDRFVVQLEADGRSQHTIEQYRRHIGLLARWLAQEGHSEDVDDIGHELLARFLTSANARGSRRGGLKRATSMNALRSSLRAFFSYCRDAGWAKENAARLVRRALTASGPPRGLSDGDRSKLLGTLASAVGTEAQRDHALFHFMLATGARLSAALALTVGDVDLEQGHVTLRHSKGDRVEVLFLAPAIRQHLARYLAGRASGFVFQGPNGNAISRRHAARRLAIWMRKSGNLIFRNPHSLRHDFANRLYQRTGDLLVVQQALGHRSVFSTLTYARANPDRVRSAVEQLATTTR